MIHFQDKFSLKIVSGSMVLLLLSSLASGCKKEPVRPDNPSSSSKFVSSGNVSQTVTSSEMTSSYSVSSMTSSQKPANSSKASSASSYKPSSSAVSNTSSILPSSSPEVPKPQTGFVTWFYKDSLSVKASHFKEGKATPLVLFFHDGDWTNSGLFDWSSEYKELSSYLQMMKESFLEAGYAVASCQYLSPTVKNSYPSPVNNAKACIESVKSKASELNINPAQIILVGQTAGAYVSLMTALSEPSLNVSAVISLSGLTDIDDYMMNADKTTPLYKSTKEFFYPSNASSSMLSSNPYSHFSPIEKLTAKSPTSILFYLKDNEIYKSQSKKFTEAAKKVSNIETDSIERAFDENYWTEISNVLAYIFE